MTDAIAQRGINIEAWSLGYGSHGALAFLGHDEKGIKSALTADRDRLQGGLVPHHLAR